MSSPWHAGPLAGFDIESTGTDPEQARVVTWCYASQHAPDDKPTVRTALIDPGVEIPAEAAKVHGITTERARAEGEPAIEAIKRARHYVEGDRTPLVIYNAPYDTTLLDREGRRHGLGGLALNRPVIDPLVLDKALSFRKGSRKLVDVCAHYGIPFTGAHDAQNDTLAAMRLARVIGGLYPQVGNMTLDELHAFQVRAKAEQAASFQKWKRANGEPDAVIDPSWPMTPWTDPAADLDRDRELLAAYYSARHAVLRAAVETDGDAGTKPGELDRELVRAAHTLLGAARALPEHLRPAGAAS